MKKKIGLILAVVILLSFINFVIGYIKSSKVEDENEPLGI